MGSGRRLAEALMEHFVISESEAWKLVPLIEDIQFGGDALSDAVWPLEECGDTGRALQQLEQFHQKLGEQIEQLRTATSQLTPRRSR